MPNNTHNHCRCSSCAISKRVRQLFSPNTFAMLFIVACLSEVVIPNRVPFNELLSVINTALAIVMYYQAEK